MKKNVLRFLPHLPNVITCVGLIALCVLLWSGQLKANMHAEASPAAVSDPVGHAAEPPPRAAKD